MRKYLSSQELSSTLDRLVNADPVLIKIYAQIYCYKENPQDKKLQPVGMLLSSPRKLVLSLINALLMGVVLVLLPGFDSVFEGYGFVAIAIYAASIFALWVFIAHSCYNFQLVKQASDYLLVDELMERGIIKLKKKPF